MSRSKKSRKPGGAPTAKPKLSKQELEKIEKRVRKKTGKVAGNRQKEAVKQQSHASQDAKNKDPRIGSKTPIVLGKAVKQATTPLKAKKEQKQDTIAGIRFAEQSTAAVPAEQAIAAIEQDEKLQAILAKIADDIALTEQEVDYYNELMERHQALSEELGLDDEDSDDENDIDTGINSEDDLWDKLDRPDLSDFEE